jgi:hypothetical protein
MIKRLLIGGVVALLGMVAGGYAGAVYAGNHAQDFEFWGGRGYEAGMGLGGLAGLVVGGLVGILFAICSPRRARGGPTLRLSEQ